MNQEKPVAVWGLSVLPLLCDTEQNHNPWTKIYLQIQKEFIFVLQWGIIDGKLYLSPQVLKT